MQKEIGFYDDLTTPYEYSYSPYTKMWYNDSCEQMPEPNIAPEKINTFKLIDELGDWALWEGNEKYYNKEEEKEAFENYVKYICGEKDLWVYDCYSVSILLKSEQQEKYICVSAHEFIDLENFIKNISLNDYSCHYIECFTGVKFFLWNKGNNKIRFLVQKYGLGTVGNIDYNLLTVDFDVLIDKDEFINEFLKVINKYKNLLLTKIKEYEKTHNTVFTNPMNITYIKYWI